MRPAFKTLLAVFVSLSIIFLFACMQNRTETTSELQIIDHKLTMHSFTGDVLKSVAAIDGRVKNISNVPISSALIMVNFFDKEGDLLYTGSAIQQNFQPEEIRTFNVQFNSPDAWKTVRYDISVSKQ
jgi:hypothetical protein